MIPEGGVLDPIGGGGVGGGGSRSVSQAERELARRWRLCKTEVRRLTFPKTSDPLRPEAPHSLPARSPRDLRALAASGPCAWGRGGFPLHLTDRLSPVSWTHLVHNLPPCAVFASPPALFKGLILRSPKFTRPPVSMNERQMGVTSR